MNREPDVLQGRDGRQGSRWGRRSHAVRIASAAAFGGGLAVLTGSTPIGIAIVAAIGAGLAAAYGRKEDQRS